jgi:hypothetical protein
VQYHVLPFRFDLALIGRLTVRHHHPDLAAQVLLVETERSGTLPAKFAYVLSFIVGSPGK